MQDARTQKRSAPPRTDAEQNRIQNGKRHKRKRRGKSLRVYLMVLFLMLTVGLLLIFNTFFKVAQVRATGMTRYTEEALVTASGILPEMNLFRLNRKGIGNNLVAQFSYLKEVRVKFQLPDTVILEAVEAEAIGAIKQGDTYLLFSQSNRVLETGVAEPPGNLPVVRGIEAGTLKAGEQMDLVEEKPLALQTAAVDALKREVRATKDDATLAEKTKQLEAAQAQLTLLQGAYTLRTEKIAMLHQFLSAVDFAGITGITAVDLSDQYNIIAHRGEQVELRLGSELELDYKLEMVNKVLTDQMERHGSFEGRIDASYPRKAYVKRMNLAAQNMTEDQYAQYLYETAGGTNQPLVVTEEGAPASGSPPPASSSASQAEEEAPAASSSAASSSAAAGTTSETSATELPAKESTGDGEDFIPAQEEP